MFDLIVQKHLLIKGYEKLQTRKLRGTMENVNLPIRGLKKAKFPSRNMKYATERGWTWSSKEFPVKLKVVKR